MNNAGRSPRALPVGCYVRAFQARPSPPASSALTAPGPLPFCVTQVPSAPSAVSALRSVPRRGPRRGGSAAGGAPMDITFTGFARAASLQAPAGRLKGDQSPLRGSTNKKRGRGGWGRALPRACAPWLLSRAPCGASQGRTALFVFHLCAICVICGRSVVVSVPIDITFTGFARAASLQAPAGRFKDVQPEGLGRNSPRHRRG